MEKEEAILAAIINRCEKADGKLRLTCAEAFSIAEQEGLAPAEIARICNQNNIRICKCQLGLFK